MGNLVLYPRASSSISAVIPNLITLTKCNPHKGLREDILKIFKNFVYYISKHFFISRSELRRISKHTSLEGIEEVVFTYFLKPQQKKVNIMEVLAGIITYSFMDFEGKVNIAIHIFDFDGSKNLTEDEFFIMMKCFISGISVMTFGVPAENSVIKSYVSSLYRERMELKNNEIIVWVRQNPILFEIFQINQPETAKPAKVIKRKLNSMDFKSFDLRGNKANCKVQSSYSVKRNNNYSVVIDSKIITKYDIVQLKEKFDELSRNGWSTLKEIVPVLAKLGYKLDSSLDSESTLPMSFNNLLEVLYRNATKNQVNRLLKFAGIKVLEDNSKDPDKTLNIKHIIEPKQIKMLKNIFKKYDLNHDGKVDLKELKLSLRNAFTDETIEQLYNQYSGDSKGLNLREFIKMYAPDDTEIPENLNTLESS